MRVLIYEPIFWGGHNLTHVRLLLRLLSNWPVELTVVTGVGAEESSQYQNQLRRFEPRFTLAATVASAGPGEDWGAHYYDRLVEAIDQLAPDHVLIPSGDLISAYAGSRRLRRALRVPGTPVETDCNVINGFYRSSTPRRHKLNALKTSIYSSYAPWTRTFSSDAMISVDALPWRWVHGSAPERLPDPLDTPDDETPPSQQEARRLLGLPSDGLIVGCAGHFASHGRKNPVELIQGFLQSGLAREGRVALVGVMGRDILDHVASLGADRDRVILINRFVSIEEIQAAVIAFNLVCLPYQNFDGPSGIVVHAAALGRPVLASPTPWFQAMIPRFQLGWTTELTDAGQIASALLKYRTQWETFSPSPASRALAAFSHWRNYGEIFCRRLRARLGMPSVPTVTWQDVVRDTEHAH